MNKGQKRHINENSPRISAGDIARKLTIKDARAAAQDFYFSLFGKIALLGLLVYSNTFFSSFHFDDSHVIQENFDILKLSRLIEHFHKYERRIIPMLTFFVNYQLGQLNVLGYHIVNIAVHILNSVLVFFLGELLFRTSQMKTTELARSGRLISVAAALIFLTHPVQTNAVTYIVQRMASLMSMFYIASLVFYLMSRLDGKGRYYWIALLSGFAAMYSKENAFTLPFAILLCEGCFFGTASLKKTFLRVLPFVLISLVIPADIFFQNNLKGILPTDCEEIPRLQYLMTQFNVIGTYLRLLVLPVRLNLDYDYPIVKSLLDPGMLFSALLLTSIIVSGLVLFRRGQRLFSFCIFWFFLSLSVESTIVPIRDVIFEHRLYLPMVGFAFFLPALFLTVWKNESRVLIPLALIVALFSTMTYARNGVWENQMTLWQDVIKKSPLKPRGYGALGREYKILGDYDKSLEFYDKAIRLGEKSATMYLNYGAVLGYKGKLDEAIAWERKAIALEPGNDKAFRNLAVALHGKGEIEEARKNCLKAVELNPYSVEAYVTLGEWHFLDCEYIKARPYFRKAIQINPDHPWSQEASARLEKMKPVFGHSMAEAEGQCREEKEMKELVRTVQTVKEVQKLKGILEISRIMRR